MDMRLNLGSPVLLFREGCLGSYWVKTIFLEGRSVSLEELTEKRRQTQPVGPSFGSTFKNPKGDYAGRLLEAAGMKGVSSGCASFSTRHANFILNDGEATAQDYYRLIRLAQKTVKEQFDVDLQLEIELLGEFEND